MRDIYNGLLDSETKHNQVQYNTEQTNIIKNNINIKHDVSCTDCNLYNDIHNISLHKTEGNILRSLALIAPRCVGSTTKCQ